jgi:hypothetical protein
VNEGLQREITERVRHGERADDIEAELARAASTGEEAAAVWLYAWVEHERWERRLGREELVSG